MADLEFFFDFGSPASYLAATQIDRVANGAEVAWRPMLLGGVFKAAGNASPVMVPAKGRWMFHDLRRWAKRYDVPLRFPDGFPLNTLHVMRGAAALEGKAEFRPYVDAVYGAVFGRGENITEPEVLGRVLGDAGLEPQAIMTAAQDQAVKDRLKATTEEAVKRGVFGAPTIFVGDEMHFGQDRLDFVAEALARG